MEKALNAFNTMSEKYEKIFSTGFYPARKSTGFTEQNLVHSYVNALIKILGDDSLEWLEFPWKDNKQHIDAIVISKTNSSIYYIEAKRLSVGQIKFWSLSKDIERIKKGYEDKDKHCSDINNEHKIDISQYKHHIIVALADIWLENQWTKNIYDSWKGEEQLLQRFENYQHLSSLLKNKSTCAHKDFKEDYFSINEKADKRIKNYKLLIAVEAL